MNTDPGIVTRPGITLAVGQYERAEWTPDKKARVLVKRCWADVWTGSCVERLLDYEDHFTCAEVDATPDVIVLAEAWRAEQRYIEDARREAIQNCSAKEGHLALVCTQPWRGSVLRPPVGPWNDGLEPVMVRRPDGSARALGRALCNIPLDLVEVTGIAEGDQPDWAVPVTVVSKSRELGYTVMRRMAADPELLARVSAHGRMRVEMGAARAPTNWFRENNRLFGLEPR